MKRTSSILLAVICLITASTCLAQYPVPFVDQPLVPSAVAPASPEFSLTVHGAGFVSGSTVNWNGTPLATTFESAGKLTAAVPAENVSTAGTVNVTVVNPSPGGGSSNPVPFTIIAPTFNPVFNAFPVAGTTSPISVVTADFNHDGIPDLAVIDAAPAPSCNYQNFGVGSIVIFLGNGDGTFTKHSTLCFVDLLGETPRSLAVTGDLNRDGNVDLVAVSNSAGDNGDTLDIYYGNGDGTFTVTDPTAQATSAAKKAATEALTSEPQYIKGLALGDFYGNGQLNIAESQITESWGEVQVFLIPGGLLYGTPPEGGDAGPLVAGDFNGDGVLDLADAACDTEIGAGTCSPSGTLTMFLGATPATIDISGASLTDGIFVKLLPDVPFGDGASIVSGDFNGDGILDLASGGVFLGNGDGTFTQKDQPSSPGGLITDLNGDGILDFVGGDSIWLGNGDGTFQSPINAGFDTGFEAMATADFNGDGRMDLVGVSGSTVTVLLQTAPTCGNPSQNSPYSGTYNVPPTTLPLVITWTNPTSACLLYYTTDGSAPTVSSPTYPSGGLSISSTTEIRVIAAATGYNNSAIIGGLWTLNLPSKMLSPTVTVQTSSSITTTQALTVTIGVSGGSGNPVPTGTVTLSSSGYTSAPTTLSSGSATINIPANSLSAGSDSLTVSYTPPGSSTYNSTSGSTTVTVTKTTPTVTVTPSPSSITTAQALTVTVAVSGGSGNPTPTGIVTLTGGGYNAAATILSGGSASINIPAGSLATGTDTLTVSYAPDSNSSSVYNSATGTGSITVTSPAKTTPTVTVTPSASSITTAQPLTVTVAVNGTPTPTGSVTLSSGSYASAATILSSGSASINVPAGSLTVGSDILTASYSGDINYSATIGSAPVAVTTVAVSKPLSPTVTVLPSASSITTTQALTVIAAVNGGNSNPTPTGSVTLTGGGYTSAPTTLSSGSVNYAAFVVPAGSLATGTDTLTASYTGDINYVATIGTAVITVTTVTVAPPPPPTVTPTVTVTPSASSITTTQVLTVAVAVSGGSGNPIPSGSVALSSSGYTSVAITLSGGSASINIPAGSLNTGSDTLTASYSGDSNYIAASGSALVAVTVAVTVPPPTPSLTVSGTAVSVSPGATSGNISTITVTPAGGFTGSVVLTAAVTSSPTSAQYPPTLSFGSTSPVSITGTNAGTAILTISTTAATSATLAHPKLPGVPWYTAVATLACLLLFGIPARRRRWQTMLGMLALFVALSGGMLACGGGSTGSSGSTSGGSSGGSGGGGASNPGTTAGTYTVTVTGTSGTVTAIGTVSVIVQ